IERSSIVRATSVAVPTASNNGTMNDRSRPVNSIIRTTVEIGPWVVAARTAAAPSTANSPGGTPGQNQHQTWPNTPPSKAPTVREGVKSPPGAPLRTQRTVARGLSASRTNSRLGATWFTNASCETSLPFPSSCGNGIDATPSNPKTTTGAINLCHPCGLVRSAQVIARTYPTETTPAIGPASRAQITLEGDVPYAGMM